MKTAVLGASGNVGRMIVKHLLLCAEVESVLLVGRREVNDFPEEIQQDKRIIQKIVDMSNLEEETQKLLSGVNVAFITMGVGAPSKATPEELERIDCNLPTEFARAAKTCGVQQMVLLTSVGSQYKGDDANVTKRTFAGSAYYLHLKGLVEKNLSDMGFDGVSLFRPATLVGNSNTPGFANWLAPKLDWALPKKYNSINIDDLGKAMVKEGLRKAKNEVKSGAEIYEGETLFNLLTKD